MSRGKFSDTIVKQILERLVDRLAAQQNEIALAIKTEPASSLKKYSKGNTPGSSAAVRLITDKLQEGILTPSSLTYLVNQFNAASTAAATNAEKQLVNMNIEIYQKASKRSKLRNPAVSSYITKEMEQGKLFNAVIAELSTKAAEVLNQQNLYSDFVEYYTKQYPNPNADIGPLNKSDLSFIDVTQDQTFIAKNLRHGEFNQRFIQFLSTKCDAAVSEFIAINTDAGHFLGIFNQRIIRSFGLEAQFMYMEGDPAHPINTEFKFFTDKTIEPDQQHINTLFTNMLKLLSNADTLTSNIVDNLKLTAISQKTVLDAAKPGQGESSIEIQLSLANQEAGNKLSQLGSKLTDLVNQAMATTTIDNAAIDTFRNGLINFFSQITALSDYIQKIGTELSSGAFLSTMGKSIVMELQADSKRIGNLLVQTEGSYSIVQALKVTYMSILSGTPLPAKQVTNSKDSIKVNKGSKKSKPSVPTVTKKSSNKPSTSNAIKVTKIPKVRTNTASSTSLVSLQNLLNQNLHTQIQQNMGTGTRRDILNYRTGRFAESAKVERMSQSREGMITAFYSYMRNPYATFSIGGDQQSPATRDPKLLISRSIREIGATMVTNRMRAVLV